MTSLEAMNETPHPTGDSDCTACIAQGWKLSIHAIDLKTNDEITVSEGYGAFAGYLLVASGHLDDDANQIAPFDFRSGQTAHQVYRVGSLQYRTV